MPQEEIVQVFLPLGSRLSKIESRDAFINYSLGLSKQEFEDQLLCAVQNIEALLISLNRFLPQEVNPMISLYLKRVNNNLSEIEILKKEENIYDSDRLELFRSELEIYQVNLSKYLQVYSSKEANYESTPGSEENSKISQKLKEPIVLSKDFTVGEILESHFEPKLSQFQAAFFLDCLQQLDILPHYYKKDLSKIAELLFCRNGKNVTDRMNVLKNTQKGEDKDLLELQELIKEINKKVEDRIKWISDRKKSNL